MEVLWALVSSLAKRSWQMIPSPFQHSHSEMMVLGFPTKWCQEGNQLWIRIRSKEKDRMIPSWDWSSLLWQLGLGLLLWLIPVFTGASASLPLGLAKEMCWNRSQSARTRWWGHEKSLTWGATSCSETWPWWLGLALEYTPHAHPQGLPAPKECFHRQLPTGTGRCLSSMPASVSPHSLANGW